VSLRNKMASVIEFVTIIIFFYFFYSKCSFSVITFLFFVIDIFFSTVEQ
jgi:hypothetical protein